MAYEKMPEWRLWLRSLMPSAGSLAGSLVLVVSLIGFHWLLLSSNPDLVAPHLAGRAADDRLAKVYESAIQQPLDRAFGNDALGVLSTALVWGLAGLVVYTVADFLISNILDWRRSNTDISMPNKNSVIRHPLHQQLIIRLLWRFLIGIALIVITIALQPVVSNLFARDVALLQATSALEMLRQAAIILACWMAITHIYVVLLRLFVLRTRVFGEIIY